MKRFFSALALCGSLLAVLAFWLFPASAAKEDAVMTLLNLPAPPPPNPLVSVPSGNRPPEFYSKNKPPPDTAPIEDLMDYWSKMSAGYQELGYNPKPSPETANRILRELASDPDQVVDFLNVFQDDKRVADLARDMYRKLAARGDDDDDARGTLRAWLTKNTADFSQDLERTALKVKDVGEYVSNQDELLALTAVDWDRAAPIVNRLYGDKTQKVSQVLATWALYKRAMEAGGSDVDKYRDELKAVVENKEATAAMRDLALDALLKEKEWSGRDDWYMTLLADETLHELKVNGQVYTGLTTIMYYSSDDRLYDRMIGLMSSDNIAVRTAAAKNLLLRLNRMGQLEDTQEVRKDIVRALLPWLSDKKWIKVDPSQRAEVVRALQSVKMPEAVPALIAALDEKEPIESSPAYAANVAVNAAVAAVNAAIVSNRPANSNVTVANTNTVGGRYISRQYYPLRSNAITALGNQHDGRAVPALRRALVEVEEWERVAAVKALLDCNGFTTEEKVAALEFMARSAGDVEAISEDSNAYYYGTNAKERAKTAMRTAIAAQRTTVSPSKEEIEDADKEFENYSAPISAADEADAYSDHHEDLVPGSSPLTEEDLKALVGAQLVSSTDVDEVLIRSMVERIGALDKREPVIADTLRKVVLGWNGAALNAMLLGDIKAGKLDADAILKLLSIRKELREKQLSDILNIRTGNPAAAGIAACLLEDRTEYDAILTNGPDVSKVTLLACGRLIRAQLPLEKTLPLLKGQNRMLAVAAERFLEAEDSPQARAAVLSNYPGQAKILGASTAFNIEGLSATPGTFLRDIFRSVNPYFGAEEYAYLTFADDGGFAETEKRLRKEVTANPDLLGIYAYDKHFVRIYKDKAVFSWEDDPARYRERVLEPEQFESLKSFLAGSKVEVLPPFLACSSECESKELLMIGRSGGRRIFLKTGRRLPEFFAGLVSFFEEMKKQPARLKYYAGDQIPGLEVLYAGEDLAAKSVWKQGADLRVLVSDSQREKAVNAEIDAASERETAELEAEGKGTDELYSKFEKIRETRKFESFAWHRLAEGQLGEAVPQPREVEYIPFLDNLSPANVFGQWKARTRNAEIRADDSGLYKIVAGRAVRIRAGNYSEPVVTPDGRCVVVSKFSEDDGFNLVRVNLVTNREYKIESGDVPVQKAIANVEGRSLVLVTGYEGEGEDGGEYEENYHPSAYDNGLGYYFLNPETGMVYSASGEVRPIAQQTFRGLQPTGRPGEFWAALPRGTAGTLVGLYSTRNFGFTPLLKLPKIVFDSMEMWVDASESKVYFTYQGHLLSVPLAAPAAGPPR